MSTYRHPEELIEAVIKDYLTGMSTTTAAVKNGVSPKTANNWVRDAGVIRTHAEAKQAETVLMGGHWMPNTRGVQIWQPCFYDSVHACNINHQAAA